MSLPCSEIGFTLLLFDPVDLFPFSKVRIVQFLFKVFHPQEIKVSDPITALAMKYGDAGMTSH